MRSTLLVLVAIAISAVSAENPNCTDDPYDAGGNLICISWLTSKPMSCDECLGKGDYEGYPALSIGPQESSYDGDALCYHSDGNGNPENPGRQTACPGDPAPKKMPDDSETGFDGVVDAFCAVQGDGFALWAACYAWSLSQAVSEYDEIMIGITALCDTFTLGLCTAIDAGVVGKREVNATAQGVKRDASATRAHRQGIMDRRAARAGVIGSGSV